MSLPQFTNPDFSVGLTGITNFPGTPGNSAEENTDFFPSLFDLPSELFAASEEFNAIRSRPPQPGDQQRIAQLLEILGPYLITPENFNKLTASMTKIQYMWHTEIHDYIMRMQNQLKFFGEWNPNTQYQLHNKVSRAQSGAVDPHAGELFICINRNGSQNNPLPVAPNFQNAHWRRISTSTQGAPGIAVNFLGNWSDLQGRTFEVGDGIRWNGIEYYCRISTSNSPAQQPLAWETFWPVISVDGDIDARPNNNSMRQNTILYRTHEGTTFVEHWRNNEWHSLNVRTNADSVEFGTGVMLPEELANIRRAIGTVQSNLDQSESTLRDSIGNLSAMNNVEQGNRVSASVAINWTAGRANSAHTILNEHGGRLNTLEGRDFASQFLTLNGSNQMSGNLRVNNHSHTMNVNQQERVIIHANGTNRSNLEFGNGGIASVTLTAANNNVRVGNNLIIHSGNIGTQHVADAATVGGVNPANLARRNAQNTFTGSATFNAGLGSTLLNVNASNGNRVGGIATNGSILQFRTGESGFDLMGSGAIRTTSPFEFINASVGDRNLDWWHGTTNANRIRLQMTTNGRWRISKTTQGGTGATVMDVLADSNTPNFPAGLSVQGRRVWIQASAPANPAVGDLHLW